jgi:hypothetical protein
MERYKPGDDARGPIGRLIDVIANAAIAGWGPDCPHRALADRGICCRGTRCHGSRNGPLLKELPARPRDCPVQPDRCQWFAVQGHCSRVCPKGRAEGAPLTVAFNGERIFGTVTVGRVTRTDRLYAAPKTHVTASSHRPAGIGDSRPALGAAPSTALPRERGRGRPTPRARTVPHHSPLSSWPWWSLTRRVSRSRSSALRVSSSRSLRGLRPGAGVPKARP